MFIFRCNDLIMMNYCVGQGTIILMNKDFDPVFEVPIHSEIFAAGQWSVVLCFGLWDILIYCFIVQMYQ